MLRTPIKPRFGEYLTVGEAAKFLGVSTWTLRNWDKAGKLKPRRHPKNGYRIYRHEDLESLLETAESVEPGTAQQVISAVDWSDVGEREHFVQFYEHDAFLAGSVASYIGTAIDSGGAGVVIGTPAHRTAIKTNMEQHGIDVSGALSDGRYVELDAQNTLSQFMVEGLPDHRRFREVIGGLIQTLSNRSKSLRAFGEMVALLWVEGNRDGAIRLEQLWNELAKEHAFALFCAYPMSGFDGTEQADPFADVCTCHSRVLPSEEFSKLSGRDEQLREVSLLQQKARSLEAEIAHRKAVENDLQRRERELNDFFENALEGIHRVGPDGTIQWANKAELRLLGYNANEYIGHRIADFHVDQEVIEDILSRLQGGQELHNCPARLRCKDGTVRHVLINSNGCMEDGKFVYSRCFTRDVTERWQVEEQLRQSEQRFSQFMQFLPGLAWIKDKSGRYVYVNAAAEKAFQASRAELYGKTDHEVFPPETAAQFRENDQRALAGGVQVIETLSQNDGIVHHSLVAKFPIPGPGGEPAFVGGVAVDITERVAAEQALRIADRRKDEFLATLAHELRNPLAPIRNALQTMKLESGDDRSIEEARTIMERQVQHMVRLVDDLLDVSRITQNRLKLHKQPIELSAVITSAIETSRPLIEQCGHELVISVPAEPIQLDGDLTRLAQVFSNLLNNSAKYTEHGGRIELTAEQNVAELVITVSDNGLGIAAESLSQIFEMFRQVDQSLERSQGGLGIGLSLVRQLVELHGGKVTAHSAGPGQGSSFVVTLPLATHRVLPHDKTAEKNDAAKGPSRRILIVDDNRDAAITLGMLLRFKGNEVRVAHDGHEAIEVASEFVPNLIFMDVGMPKLNGYDATRQIRQKPWGKEPVIVALTGWGQVEDIQHSLEAGCTTHMTKPIDPAALDRFLAEMSPPRTHCGSLMGELQK